MWYALGTDAENAPGEDSAWSKSVPRATDADTYYVWYKVIGDGKYSDTEPACIEVTIRKTRRQLIAEAKANTVTITDISSKLIGTLTVGWESEYPADGYDVVLWNTRRMGGNMLVSRFDVDGSESGINVYGLIPNSRYYVRVRAYKVIDGERVYGRFSETESVSVKGFFFTRLFAPAYSYGRPYLSPSRYTAATDPYFFYRF